MITAGQKTEPMPAVRSKRPSRGSVPGPAILFLFALSAVLALGAGLGVRQAEARSRLALAAARSEHHALTVRQEALRTRLFEVARRLETLEPGRPTDPGRERRLPRPDWGRGSI